MEREQDFRNFLRRQHVSELRGGQTEASDPSSVESIVSVLCKLDTKSSKISSSMLTCFLAASVCVLGLSLIHI